ncbi:MAG: hypothetical protein KDA92_08820 [Planctomycetales bacterium]|nr:hypothetical protein [Planctomycetales bacterium]MCA9167940.1 hypothetical protein [Planctomycetales bacterium]
MASAVEKARATAGKTLIFVGPFDKLDVSGGSVHDLDSSMALATARSWYFFASSPALHEMVTGLVTLG